jgi:prepilin-type N-terminal cleavage/methylation domain-containing protein
MQRRESSKQKAAKNRERRSACFLLSTAKSRRGFTVIEMMVSVALFAVVMLVSAGALLSLASANRKAQALQSVMNNLNTTLDSMVRSMRGGSNYDCQPAGTGIVPGRMNDCPNGDTQIAFEPHGGNPSTPDQRVYAFIAPNGSQSGYVRRSEDGGTTWSRVTAPEISIVDMKFYVIGTTPGDTVQPKAVVEIKGVAGSNNAKITSTFHIQATAVQRVLDI